MRKNVRALVELLARELPMTGPVVEVGSYRVPGQEEVADLREVLGSATYIGIDARAGTGVDVVADGVRLPFDDGVAGTVLVLETVEHAPDPMGIAREAFRICAPGGAVLLTTCLDFRIHHHPDDYWRFTPSAMNLLVESFPVRVVGFQGHPKFPHSVFSLGIKSDGAETPVHEERIRVWKETLQRRAAFPRSLGERARVALASLIHSRALRSYRMINHYEIELVSGK